jgi:hypothetical protein
MEWNWELIRFRNVEIHHDGFLSAAHHDSFDRLISPRIHLLVRHVWRDVNKIARPGFFREFQMVSPPEESMPSHDVEHRFDFPVVVSAGAGCGLDHDGSRPELVGASASVRDRRRARHAGRLGSIAVELTGAHNPYTACFPVHRFPVPRTTALRPVRSFPVPAHNGPAACAFDIQSPQFA